MVEVPAQNNVCIIWDVVVWESGGKERAHRVECIIVLAGVVNVYDDERLVEHFDLNASDVKGGEGEVRVGVGGDIIINKDEGAGCGRVVINEDVRVEWSPRGGSPGVSGTNPGFLN